jgi:1,4-dihydroxy-2-naphthoate octaprenyltransferase
MVSGSSLIAYWLGHYIADILFQTLPSVVAIFSIWAFGINVDDVWILFTLLIFANPSFIYFLSFIIEKEETGSLVVKMIYFVIGVIAPIAISIL